MQTLTVQGYELPIREYNGQRVITLREIDEVHRRPEGTARRNFNANKERFLKDTHFYLISEPSEMRTLGFERPQGGLPEKVYLITQRGYLLLVKSFTDDLAWQIQDTLVTSYFLLGQKAVEEAQNAAPQQYEERPAGFYRRSIRKILEVGTYWEWAQSINKPLETLRDKLELKDTAAVLCRLYRIFTDAHGFSISDIKDTRVSARLAEDDKEGARKLLDMSTLEFIYSERKVRDAFMDILRDAFIELGLTVKPKPALPPTTC